MEVILTVNDWIFLCDFIASTLDEIEKQDIEPNEYGILRNIDSMRQILATVERSNPSLAVKL